MNISIEIANLKDIVKLHRTLLNQAHLLQNEPYLNV